MFEGIAQDLILKVQGCDGFPLLLDGSSDPAIFTAGEREAFCFN